MNSTLRQYNVFLLSARLSLASLFSSFLLVADLSASADKEAEGDDDGDDHHDGSDTGRSGELLLDGDHASFLRRSSGDVTVPPPGGRSTETLAAELFLNRLHELLDLLLSLSDGLAFSDLGLVVSDSFSFL